MRKHPVLLGLLLLVVVGVVMLILIYGVALLRGTDEPFSRSDRVGVVEITGVISSSRDAIELMDRYERDSHVRAVVIRIDSPGGGVVPAQEIYDRVGRLKKKKKVVISMGSVAASGGYYIACAGDRVIANPGTITGSIGVIIQFSQVRRLLDKIGVEPTVIKGGKYKDVGSPVREMTADERALIQGVVDDIYDQFLDAVATGRAISKDEVRSLAEGKIYTGKQALALGLIDELGNEKHAIRVAARLAGIEGKPHVIYPERKRRGLLRYLTREILSGVSDELRGSGTGIDYLYRGDGAS